MGHHDSKDTDDTSTDNGSSNGDNMGIGSSMDASTMLAAREKSLISHAMETLNKRVAEYDSGNVSESDEEMTDLPEGQVVQDGFLSFKLATPTPLPTHLNIHFICETASRLLFLSVHWVRSVPVFSQLR